MADIIPHNFILQQAIQVVNFNTHSFKCILCGGSYVESTLQDYKTYGDVSANELNQGNGYLSGGVDVTGTSAIIDDTNNRLLYKCDDIQFTASGGNIGPARYAVMYDPDGANTLIYCFDFGANKTILDGSSLLIRVDSTAFIRAYQKT
jgi:hypothetical protein